MTAAPGPQQPDEDAGYVCNGVSELVASKFHEAYERLAPSFGYATREASAKPWSQVPENNRRLMTAVVHELLLGPNATLTVRYPGPTMPFTQPDEVRRELFDSEDVANTVRAIADDLLVWAATLPTGADPHEVYDWLIAQAAAVARPAAPSAQPDEVCMCDKPENDEVHGAPEPCGGHAFLPASGHPAAPSAQPDEVLPFEDEHVGYRYRRTGEAFCRTCSHQWPCPTATSAQPVRDTGEGRR